MRLHNTKQNRSQLVFIFAGIAIAGVIIGVTGNLLSTIEEQLQTDAKKRVVTLTEQAASNATDHVLMTEHAIESFTLQDSDIKAMQPALQNLKERFSFTEVAYVGVDGIGCRADGNPFSFDESLPSKIVHQHNGINYCASYFGSSGEYVYQATREISIDGQVVGTLYVGIPVDMMLSKYEFNIFDGTGFFIPLESGSGKITMSANADSSSSFSEGSLIL